MHGWIFRSASPPDYGIDAEIEIVRDSEPSGRLIKVQLKAKCRSESQQKPTVRCQTKHLQYWMQIDLPVILVLYLEDYNEAYWIWVQDFIVNHLDKIDPYWMTKKTKIITFPKENAISESLSAIEDLPNRQRLLTAQTFSYKLFKEQGTPARLLATIEELRCRNPKVDILQELLERLTPIEQGILELRNTPLLRPSYEAFLVDRLRSELKVSSLDDISTGLTSSAVQGILNTSKWPKNHLQMRVSSDLKHISFKIGKQRWTISKPERLLDCTCRYVTRTKCRLHGNKAAKDFDRAWKNKVQIKHRGIEILYHGTIPYPSAWPPSLESLKFTELVIPRLQGPFSRVIDVGCGSGYLGIALAHNLNLNEISFLDWVPSALVLSCINFEKNRSKTKNPGAEVLYICEDGIEQRLKKGLYPYDLAICNPPFLPDLGIPKCRIKHTVYGTDLLLQVLSNSTKLANTSYIAFSSLVEKEVKPAIKQLRANVDVFPDNGFLMPFNLSYVLDNKQYLSRLLREKRLMCCPHLPHKYYHRVYFIEVKK